jgi:hypothetical protein
MLDKTIKAASSIDVAITNSHNLHSTTTPQAAEYEDLEEELIRMWQLTAVYVIPLALSTAGIIRTTPHQSSKTAAFSPCCVRSGADSSNA